MKKKIFTGICIFFLIHFLQAQVIPPHRIIDWSYAGTSYDFSYTQTIDVSSFGAMGDGAYDNLNAVNSAISSFNGSRGVVFFPPGVYLMNGSISLPDSVSLIGATADSSILKFNVGSAADAINIKGQSTGNFMPIIGGGNKGSFVLYIDTPHVFVAGDMLELIQDGQYHMTSSWAMTSLGQMLLIDSVNEGALYLNTPLTMTYEDTLNPRIRKIIPRRACSIECLKIERVDATVNQSANIGFNYAYNCKVLGVESYKCNFAHIDARKSLQLTIKNAYFHDAHDFGNGGKAYGVCLHATATYCLVENNIFKLLRHAMLLQSGANANVFAYNYSREPYWTGVSLPANSAGDMVLHGNYPYVNLFEGNIGQHIVIDDSHGKNGHHNTFFRNRAELYGIFMNNAPATDSTNFVGNEITNTGFLLGNYVLMGTNHFQYGNNHKGIIKPTGTGNLQDMSLFYQQQPPFFTSFHAFPPIGPVNLLDAHAIPAKDRFLSNVSLTPCVDTVFTTYAHYVKENDLTGYFDVVYRQTDKTILLHFYSKTSSKTDILVVDVLGKELIYKSIDVQSGDNTIEMKMPTYIASAYLLVSIRQIDFVGQKKMFVY